MLISLSSDCQAGTRTSSYTVYKCPSVKICGEFLFIVVFVIFFLPGNGFYTEHGTGIYNDSYQNKTNQCHSKISN